MSDSWNGLKYHVNSDQQYDVATRMLSSMSFNGNEKVLDIGCGTGKVTANIAQNIFPNGNVVGIDVSMSMLETAKQEYKYVNNLSFELIDATCMNFHEQFDVIVSFNTFHWIKNIKALFYNISKSLKPEGKLTSMFSIDDLTDRYSVGMPLIRELMVSSTWKHYFPSKETEWNNFGIAYYSEQLDLVNMKGTIEVKQLPDWIFETRDKYIEYFFHVTIKIEYPI